MIKAFSQYENVLFDIFSELLANGKQDISIEEIQAAVANKLYDMPVIDQQTLMNDFPVFYKDEDGYHPIIDTYDGFPIRLTKLEQQAVCDALSSDDADIFLSANEKAKISDSFSNTELCYDKEPIQQNTLRFHPSQRTVKNVKNLITAINQRKVTRVQNLSPFSPVREPERAFPVSLEYTAQSGLWTVAAYVPSAKRFINFNVSKIEVELTEESFSPSVKENHKAFIKSQKKRTAVIRIDAPNYAIDRIFRLFSFYERKTVIQNNGSYLMTLQYYEYDKDPLIRNILSAGPYAMLQSPDDLKADVVSAIQNALSAV